MADTAVEYPKASELRSKLVEAGGKLRDLREMAADKRGDSYVADVNATIQAIHSWDADLKVAESLERAAAIEEQTRQASQGPSAATANIGNDGSQSLGQRVVGMDEYRTWKDSGAKLSDFRFEIGGETRTLITTSQSDTPSAGLLLPVAQPIPPVPRQIQFFIRDLLSSGQTNYHSFPYIRELIPATNESAATAVPEGSSKPEVTMSFTQVTATVHKIAAWVPATNEILEDAPTLRSYIDQRLVYMVKYREQADLLYGEETGTNPTVPGILSSGLSGSIQTETVQQSNSTDDMPKTLGLSIAKIELVDGEPDGIAMHPTDYWTMLTTRWGTAGGLHDSGSPFVGPPGTVWGLPVVRTRALTVKTAVVGAWRMGGQVFDREGVTIRTSDSHDTYFVQNKVAILAEERLAVAWYRPDFFVKATVAS